jgi:hypothetical protein
MSHFTSAELDAASDRGSEIITALATPVARIVRSVMAHMEATPSDEPDIEIRPSDIVLGAADENLRFWLRANHVFSQCMSDLQSTMQFVSALGPEIAEMMGQFAPKFADFMLGAVFQDFCASISGAFVIETFGEQIMALNVNPSDYGLGVRAGYVVVLTRRDRPTPEPEPDFADFSAESEEN